VAAAIGVGGAAPGRPLVAISRWPSLLVSAESDTGSAITCLHQARVRREAHAEVSTGVGHVAKARLSYKVDLSSAPNKVNLADYGTLSGGQKPGA